jgi:hypothetical protein
MMIKNKIWNKNVNPSDVREVLNEKDFQTRIKTIF